ncbi:efflux RND transporter periplasmic adaptor subunit [Vibrio coralliilyticus OCN008]|uniref:efflux RND transporter periplasmic adaptor subunit n=1 Tax=Vibrio coralliilyticus TaxID=190893 RepID=UPI0003918102|nr:efflux RND transporter periplasmic adaptor subunit [Vibrio coralliilyticus]ERB65767.1 hypothetical protein N779_08730 [Vibrio coralliilyticus OCN008]QIJ86467.1 efflux RND transporter periplasmic adaptor subunit [Vibrio coralliilyticus OCN008]
MNIKLSILAIAGILITGPALAIELIGQVQSKHRQSIVAEVDGVVESALLEPGDLIGKNQVLARIKVQDFRFEVAKKKASLELAQANLQLTKATFERYQELVSKKSLSVNELDIAKAEYLNARANVDLAKIELEEAEQDLSGTKITSNIEGFVVSRSAESGDWVSQGDLLYQLVNIDTLTIRLLASEHDMKELNVGQPIEVWTETAPDNRIQSTIKRIGVEMDTETRAYPIEIEVDNPGFHLKPGMSVYATTSLPSNSISTNAQD